MSSPQKISPVPGVVIPCASDTGVVGGYIVSTVDTSYYFSPIAAEYPNSSNWRYWLVTSDGFILYIQYPGNICRIWTHLTGQGCIV